MSLPFRVRVQFFFCLAWILGLAGAAGCTGLAPRSSRSQLTPTPAALATLVLPAVSLALTQAPPSPPVPSATLAPTTSPTPADAAVEHSACALQSGEVRQGEISSALLRHPLDFRIYLPPCYPVDSAGAASAQRYPVLYLLHGLTYTDDQWDRLGIGQAADRLIAAGEIQPFLIVMPRDDDWHQPTDSAFGRALVSDLLPWIDANYQTRPDRQNRAIGGLSRGASWAVHIGLTDWQQFSAIGAHSLALFWTDSEEMKRILDAIPWDGYPSIYLDIGTKDLDLRSTEEFEALLMDRHYPHEWHLFPGFHDEAYWQSHLEDYLRWYAAQFNTAP